MPDRPDRETILAALIYLLTNLRDSARITIEPSRGFSSTFNLPAQSSPETIPLKAVSGETKKAILAVLTKAANPLKGRAIATRAGLNFNSYFRAALAELRKVDQLIIATDDGFILKTKGEKSA